jgi:signal transduction histidine kinase
LRGSPAWLISQGALLVLAAALHTVGTGRALLLAYASQRRELTASALVAEDLEARSRAQRHDVTNALMGLGGAAATLERFHDNLNPADREELTRGLTREVSRLQAILDQTTAEHAPFALTAVLPERADSAGSISVAAELLAVGDEEATRSVVHALLAQAAERSPAAQVTIKGERDGDWVVLRVSDGGPGIPRAERRMLFAREGTPLGAAARAMRRQGGDLWVDGRGSQTSFALCLPRAANGSAPTAG